MFVFGSLKGFCSGGVGGGAVQLLFLIRGGLWQCGVAQRYPGVLSRSSVRVLAVLL